MESTIIFIISYSEDSRKDFKKIIIICYYDILSSQTARKIWKVSGYDINKEPVLIILMYLQKGQRDILEWNEWDGKYMSAIFISIYEMKI